MGIYEQMENVKIVQHGDDQNDKFIDSIPNTIWDKMVRMSKKKLEISKCKKFFNLILFFIFIFIFIYFIFIFYFLF